MLNLTEINVLWSNVLTDTDKWKIHQKSSECEYKLQRPTLQTHMSDTTCVVPCNVQTLINTLGKCDSHKTDSSSVSCVCIWVIPVPVPEYWY